MDAGTPLQTWFDEVAGRLAAPHDIAGILATVADLAVDTVEGCHHAGVVLWRNGGFDTAAATSEVVATAHDLLARTGEGPAAVAVDTSLPCRSVDLRADARWPQFGTHVTAIGLVSAVAVPLRADAGSHGALTLYSRDRGAFDDDAVERAQILASHASVAVACARLRADDSAELHTLRGALDSRDLIGQAKGILMERHRLTADEAFARLRSTSQERNRKLREVAADLVASGELASGPSGRRTPPPVT